jgi:hypothetical protein
MEPLTLTIEQHHFDEKWIGIRIKLKKRDQHQKNPDPHQFATLKLAISKQHSPFSLLATCKP